MSPPVIELRQVAVSDPRDTELALIEDVTWTIEAGDYWVIGGSPSSGKNHLLAVASGLQKPLRGFCELFGRDATELSADELAQERLRIGLVFGEDGRLFQNLTIAENIALPLSYHRNEPLAGAAEKVAALLELTGLAPLAHRRPSGLERWLRGRAALARALILEPEILLLEDPLRGLDRREARWWLDLLGQLSRGHACMEDRAMTIVVAADDLRTWLDQAGKFGLINGRRWMFLGGRTELKAHTEPLVREMFVDDFNPP